MFYPQIEGKTKRTNYSIDTLPRKTTLGDLVTFMEENIDFGDISSLIDVEDEGISVGVDFDTFNFIGPLVTATDSGADDTVDITVTGTLMSSFTDVSPDYYQGLAAWLTDTRTTWSGNEPSVANISAWLTGYNANTFVMVWNPVDDEWMPMPAFDIVSTLDGAAENLYNTSDALTGNRVVDTSNFTLGLYQISGYAWDQGQMIMDFPNDILRIHGHRLRANGSGESDIQLGYYNAEANQSTDLAIKFFVSGDETINSGQGNARILRTSGANGVFEMANDGTGGVRLQAGGLSGTTNEFRLSNVGLLTASEYGSGTHTGTATYSLAVDSSGNIIEAGLSGSNTNFAEDNLTADANRSHNFASFDLLIDNVNDLTLNSEGETVLTAHNNSNHFIKSITSGTQNSWFLRANDGSEGVTIQLVADATTPANSQIELGTGSTGAPIIFDTDGYVQVDGQTSTSGEFRIQAMNSAYYVAQSVDTSPSGASSYTLTYPNSISASAQFFSHDGTGDIVLLTEGSHIAIQGTTLAVVPDDEFDLGANSIGGTAQSATGDGSTTINWTDGNAFNFTFGAFNETFIFNPPTNPGTFILKLVQDSVGSRTATWPATVKWPGGAAPTLTTTATTGTDIITFYYDGTNYFTVSTLNFS